VSNSSPERGNSTTPEGPAPPTVVWRGAKFSVEQIAVRGTDGVERRREVIRHPGAVVILPILPEAGGGAPARVVLIHNYRIALGRSIWELPAGTLEPGEDPAHCAGRELEEETGFRAATITPLTRFYTTPGMTNELMWAYVAKGLTHVGARPEPDERMTVHTLDAAEVLAMIGRGELMDGKSIVTLLLAERQGLLGTTGCR
jgi:ADP-ribose pyrophosphatase